jgi:NAD(P)-dependent dehydrogenase (short-subunit alcohol dehydrogenase family)
MPISPDKKTIVITGCSSGFGRVTALHLAKHGWQVFATVRREEDQAGLLAEAKAAGCDEYLLPLICDITSAEQVAALGQTVSTAAPRLGALLNNAGTAVAGPMELLALDDLREQFEINVIAHVGVTQVLLPLLKASRGKIINVSSMNGRIATPATGAYAGSKFALEAISDTWRVELAPFGVRVVVIEPSASTTNIWRTGRKRAEDRLEEFRNGPYKRLLNTVEKFAQHSEKHGFPPQLFADTVLKILNSRRPRARYVIPPRAKMAIVLHQLLPDWLWDWQIRRMMRW